MNDEMNNKPKARLDLGVSSDNDLTQLTYLNIQYTGTEEDIRNIIDDCYPIEGAHQKFTIFITYVQQANSEESNDEAAKTMKELYFRLNDLYVDPLSER